MQEKILQQPVYGTITLYGLTIPDEIQPTNKKDPNQVYTPHFHTRYRAGFGLFCVGFARRY